MNNELCHHGILGQKWGKRNGPPYPLGIGDHSSSEKKAGWRKSLDSNGGGSRKPKSVKSEKESNKPIKVTEKELRDYRQEMIAKSSKNASRKEFFENATDKELADDIERKQKMKQIALAVAAGAGLTAGIYFAYKYSACGSISELLGRGSASPEALKKVMERTLEDGTTILDKGSIIHRMEGYSDVDYSKMVNPLYTSYRDADVATYMTMLKDWAGTGKRYDVTLQAMKDIRIPSKERAVELFNELWNNDPEYRSALRETIINSKFDLLSKSEPGMYSRDAIAAAIDQELSKDPFGKAIYSMVLKGDDSKMYTEALQKAGYDAIFDYFDKGKMADAPLIVLDPSRTLQKVGEQVVTQQFKTETLQKLKASGITKLAAGKVSIDDVMKW